jgi:hypothetical protein
MCCDGVLFYGVKLQPSDSARALRALGLKVKRKYGHEQSLQPCAAHQNCSCSIYADRPQRCREFECRQLVGLARAELSETQALENILHARTLVDRVEALLLIAKDERLGKALATRCETVFTPPLDDSPGAAENRVALGGAIKELEAFLSSHFRVELPPSELGC